MRGLPIPLRRTIKWRPVVPGVPQQQQRRGGGVTHTPTGSSREPKKKVRKGGLESKRGGWMHRGVESLLGGGWEGQNSGDSLSVEMSMQLLMLPRRALDV